MKAYKWSEYSELYCNNYTILESNEDKSLIIYEAFNDAYDNTMYFIVYKDNVIIEGFNHKEMIYKFFGMLDLIKHLKEEGELK